MEIYRTYIEKYQNIWKMLKYIEIHRKILKYIRNIYIYKNMEIYGKILKSMKKCVYSGSLVPGK